jgi:hypothetical protein
MSKEQEEQMLAKIDKLYEMLDFAILQLRDTNLRLTEIIMRLPPLETGSSQIRQSERTEDR